MNKALHHVQLYHIASLLRLLAPIGLVRSIRFVDGLLLSVYLGSGNDRAHLDLPITSCLDLLRLLLSFFLSTNSYCCQITYLLDISKIVAHSEVLSLVEFPVQLILLFLGHLVLLLNDGRLLE